MGNWIVYFHTFYSHCQKVHPIRSNSAWHSRLAKTTEKLSLGGVRRALLCRRFPIPPSSCIELLVVSFPFFSASPFFLPSFLSLFFFTHCFPDQLCGKQAFADWIAWLGLFFLPVWYDGSTSLLDCYVSLVWTSARSWRNWLIAPLVFFPFFSPLLISFFFFF